MFLKILLFFKSESEDYNSSSSNNTDAFVHDHIKYINKYKKKSLKK